MLTDGIKITYLLPDLLLFDLLSLTSFQSMTYIVS